MSTELIINASLPETRIALMEDGEIQDLLIERASGKGIVGNIYKGRVTRVLPGMQAAFVDIGLEKAAFLYVDDVYVHPEIWEKQEELAPASQDAPDAPDPGDSEGGSGSEGLIAAGTGVIIGAATGQIRRNQKAETGEGQDAASGEQQASGQAATSGSYYEEADDNRSGRPSTPTRNAPMQEATEADAAAHLSGEEDEEEEEESESGAHASDEDEEVGEEEDEGDEEDEDEDEDGEDEDDDDEEPVRMAVVSGGEGGDGGDSSSSGNDRPPIGTIAPSGSSSSSDHDGPGPGDGIADHEIGTQSLGENAQRRHRRGRRGGRTRNRRGGAGSEGGERGGQGGSRGGPRPVSAATGGGIPTDAPDSFQDQVAEHGETYSSDRGDLSETNAAGDSVDLNRPQGAIAGGPSVRSDRKPGGSKREEFKETRGRDRKIRTKGSMSAPKAPVKIEDLLKEGQEVIVQVAKDPIATKGARLTCHISLPGRHLVCMPTIDHVGVSRRIDRDEERRRLREFVERNRPKNLGFIVRTASGKVQAEKRIKQDIDYLTRLWSEIRDKASQVHAPALVYEDLNSILRAIRDWVTEEIDKIIVDSRYHFNDIQRFVSHFMPALKQKVELYAGDVPIFDAFKISTELARAMERKVWLKSGGYLVIDQAEALVAIDVNTGRYVGKKNLEDTILKTNLEAVQEIAYQLRLRNCGGIIILDLIDMEREENKHRVYRALEEALKRDRARPTIMKISDLGLVEMTRKRTRDTIVRALCESCSECEGKGFIKSKQTVAYEIMREIERDGVDRDVSKILIQAHPDVIDVLAIDERETLDQLERRYRKQVYLQAIGDYHAEQFEVIGDKGERTSSTGESTYQIQGRGGRGRNRDRSSTGSGGSGGGEKTGDRDKGGGRDRERGDRDRGRGGGRDRNNQGDRSASVPANPRKIELRPRPLPVPVNGELGEHAAGGLIVDGVATEPRHTGPAHQDGFFDEEDRLAFLRAQAAQDAALARAGGPGGAQGAPGREPGSAGSGRGPRPGAGGGAGGQGARGPREEGGGGKRGRRGRRGGKFRGPRDDQPPRPPGSGGIPRPLDTAGSGPAPQGGAPSDSTGSSGSGGSGGSGGDDSGGGGDRSNPPT